jgi:hypothetical protein
MIIDIVQSYSDCIFNSIKSYVIIILYLFYLFLRWVVFGILAYSLFFILGVIKMFHPEKMVQKINRIHVFI